MTVFIIVLTLVIVIYLLLKSGVNSIKKVPPKYPLEVLSKDPEGQTIFITQKDGSKIRTIVAGTGQSIILAHGYGASLVEWNVMAKDLVNRGYQVIMFDQKGHKKSTIGTEGITSASMASVYKDILEYFDVKNGVLVGHSMGGFLSIKFMLSYPEIVRERLKSAMIMASFAGDILKNNPQNKLQIPMIKSGIMLRITQTELLGYPFAKSLIGDHADAAMIEPFLKEFSLINHQALIPILEAFGAESYYDRLGEIDIPCTIIVGTKDETTPGFHTIDMAKGIKNSKIVRLEGKGHMLNWEAADEVVSEIIDLAK